MFKESSYDHKIIRDSKESSYDHKIDKNPHGKTIAQVDSMVTYMTTKFGKGDTHLPLYRHIAWTLSDNSIRRIIGAVMDKNPRSKLAYFIACAKREKGYY